MYKKEHALKDSDIINWACPLIAKKKKYVMDGDDKDDGDENRQKNSEWTFHLI